MRINFAKLLSVSEVNLMLEVRLQRGTSGSTVSECQSEKEWKDKMKMLHDRTLLKHSLNTGTQQMQASFNTKSAATGRKKANANTSFSEAT